MAKLRGSLAFVEAGVNVPFLLPPGGLARGVSQPLCIPFTSS